ncbi:MAG: acyltransferase [Rhodospirillales bacterium]|nr:acyltransferase [Rhodospirillales bacterium]
MLTEKATVAETADEDRLDEDKFIRDQMFGGDKSNLRRYADLVVGTEASYLDLLKYEMITCLFGRLSGALGYAARKVFYPGLFQSCGRGIVFGRDIVIRNAGNIRLGDQVVIDDNVVIDGRGAGDKGVSIGSRTILGRGVMIQAKIGPISIGDDCDIGSSSIVHSQGAVEIGDQVVLGGGSKISGGIFQIERSDPSTASSEQEARAQKRYTKGPVRIGSRCLIGMGSMFLDGVDIGEGCIIGAGTIMHRSLEPFSVAAGVPGRKLRDRPIAGSTSS